MQSYILSKRAAKYRLSGNTTFCEQPVEGHFEMKELMIPQAVSELLPKQKFFPFYTKLLRKQQMNKFVLYSKLKMIT